MSASRCSEINRNTPNVTVFSHQGLAVRQLQFYRREMGEAAQVRIHLQRYNSAGQLTSSIDPRLSASYLTKLSTTIPNQQQQNTLSGAVLKSNNVDAGTRVLFSDVRGLTLWSWDSRGTETSVDYDKLRRVIAVHEKERGKEMLCRERFRYGKTSDTQASNNTVGRLLEYLDTAGRHFMPAYSLLGQATSEERTFLKVEATVNWTDDDTENAKLLEEQSYLSHSERNALGETLAQIDAVGNQHKPCYAVSGQISQILLQLPGEAEKSLVHNRIYRATDQLQEETLGNGVRIHYTYEPSTQRLKEKRAIRLSDNELLQSLQYTYDPVGNILSIEDKAQETEHYKNAKAEPVSQYVYDSLYQLIAADGVESEQAICETSRLPEAITFGNKDARRLVNYHRDYDYDAGGNLFKLHHQGASTCTQELTIDTVSNRGIAKRPSGPSLHESLDANGNLLYLKIDQPLSWDARNQLKETIQLERANTRSDKETYLYDGQGMRLQKTRIYLSQNQIHTERVRYLSGLELRECWQTDMQGQNKQISQELYFIQTQAGDVPVKMLHWETKPPDPIENDVIYYSLSDHIRSNQVELNDAAEVVSFEGYYPYGGTAIWSTKNQIESNYKYYRYSGKERDHSGLYYYGYRYYILWLGRWLNPDPSGTADGLNLFRMTRNNPIAFYDENGMAPATLKENYEVKRGDLVYGLSGPRNRYLKKLYPDYQSENNYNKYPPFTINDYNAVVLSAISRVNSSDLGERMEAQPKEIGKIINIPDDLRWQLHQESRGGYEFLWDEYFAVAEENKKFDIKAIYQEVSENYGSSLYHEWDSLGEAGAPLLFFKRKSKSGLEMSAQSNYIHLHFMLDELQMGKVVYKSDSIQGGQSITSSELRYIFRNWDKFQEKTHFYNHGLEVDAPWIEKSSLWTKYTSGREIREHP